MFNTNMTADEWLRAREMQRRAEVSYAEAMRDQWQKEVDRLKLLALPRQRGMGDGKPR